MGEERRKEEKLALQVGSNVLSFQEAGMVDAWASRREMGPGAWSVPSSIQESCAT